MAESGPSSWFSGVASDSASGRSVAVLVIALLGAYLVACGGGDRGTADKPGGRGEPGERQARSAIPPADRAAFYGIATASGSLRGTVVAAALGDTRRPYDTAELRTLRRRLAALRPRDPGLAGLRTKLRAALSAAIREPHGQSAQRQAARRALAASDDINTGLQTYADRHPAVAGLVPD